MILTFDCETTGLPAKGAKWESDFMHFPHIVQLSWHCSGENHIEDFIIRPEGYIIPKEATLIHGISHEKAMNEGTPLEVVLGLFIRDALRAVKVVGHNVYFDSSIIKANVLRISMKKPDLQAYKWNEKIRIALDKSKRICTMQKSIKFCSIPFPSGRGGIKWPTLIELHEKLFHESFPAHNSKEDVLATVRCFDRLVELGVIERFSN